MSESQEVDSGVTVNRALMTAFFTVSAEVLSLTVYTCGIYIFLSVCLSDIEGCALQHINCSMQYITTQDFIYELARV